MPPATLIARAETITITKRLAILGLCRRGRPPEKFVIPSSFKQYQLSQIADYRRCQAGVFEKAQNIISGNPRNGPIRPDS